jgi:hypothetical protein
MGYEPMIADGSAGYGLSLALVPLREVLSLPLFSEITARQLASAAVAMEQFAYAG